MAGAQQSLRHILTINDEVPEQAKVLITLQFDDVDSCPFGQLGF